MTSNQAPHGDVQLRPYGPQAWLLDGIDDPVEWAEGLRQAAIDGVEAIVPAERTVLVRCRPDRLVALGERLLHVRPSPVSAARRDVVIDVVYDGDDLAGVADASGMSVEEVVARHTSSTYAVAFCGFSPGFAYLTGLDVALHLPRRPMPRTTVPAGAVAVAAHYTAVYPSDSPGGWHLLGSTSARVWDVARDEPALLTPGVSVRFRSV